MSNSIIAFIDVLATKESVNVSNQAFEYLITEFNRELCTNAIMLSERDEISIFSDCAFIQFSGGLDDAIGYLQVVRSVLFSKQIYFKCAIAEGNLETEGLDPFFGINKKEHIDKLRKIVSYRYFGPNSVKIYALHEKFKGIGFYVEGALARKVKESGYFVESGFYADPTLRNYIEFWDIAYQPRLMQCLFDYKDSDESAMIDSQFIDSILKSLLYSKAKNKDYARYYISTLITMIRSSDFSKIYFDCNEKTWKQYPVIFKRLYLDRFFLKHNRTVPGLDCVFFCMINEILDSVLRRLEDENDESNDASLFQETAECSIDTISRMIATRKGLIDRLRKIPRGLLHPRNSQIILERYAALGLQA